jgi:hypothetical protein
MPGCKHIIGREPVFAQGIETGTFCGKTCETAKGGSLGTGGKAEIGKAES